MAKIERRMLRALGLTLFTLYLVGCAGNNSTSLNQPPTGSRYNSNPSGPENSAPVILRSKSKFSAEKTPIKAISLLEPTTSHPGGIAIGKRQLVRLRLGAPEPVAKPVRQQLLAARQRRNPAPAADTGDCEAA